MTAIRIGFIPLVDAAPLVALKEIGFAREEGIEVSLHREISWSNIRDKLAVGLYDASHLLAPMALATNLGLAGPPADLVVPYVLNLNGDVVCATTDFLHAVGLPANASPSAISEKIRAGTLGRPVTFGVPFFFSTHHFLLRYWLAAEGIDPAKDVRIEVIPPPLMPEAIANGVIDGMMVGEPWGSVSVDMGTASIFLSATDIWAGAPEKVFGMRRRWTEENADAVHALLRALYRASNWAQDPGNRVTLSELLAKESYLDLSAEVIERALSGALTRTPQGLQERVERFMVFQSGASSFPWLSQALWFLDQMERWGFMKVTPEHRRLVRNIMAPNLYRESLSPLGIDVPSANAKLEGSLSEPTPAASAAGRLFLDPDRFCDGAIFDPDLVA
ncbi:ABC transporter substrate-binding protein [Nisaea acidiphila]|uniref:ABC transporter substrate-binding protein n=1 Tax=Nisaea acidiphila TaxID=1862145 RepID=A0A9J7AVQ6_9PROT|nr:CmpA/NrtA family ABC transporter substrate-binding protein [Nisaea acidiphila]UUX49501.1 ABC transporter substrate-binding protein [Nisaea acidiphila]